MRFKFSLAVVGLLVLLILFGATVQPPVGLNLGNTAPEIKQGSINGGELALSSLRGKLVYIDFWASWCGPCRAENPELVKVYKKYSRQHFSNGEGFDIFSVSLDGQYSAWKKAIEVDQLLWSNHVSDLQGWNSSAAMRYGITSIPVGLLINGEGVIIRKNIRPSDLDQILSTLVKK